MNDEENSKQHDRDLLRINALVDGELLPAERAQIAARMAADRNLARSHATLARLKASVMEIAEDAPCTLSIPKVAVLRPRQRLAIRLTAAAALVLAVSSAAWTFMLPARQQAVREQKEHAITLAAFPVRPVVPDFASAGLILQGVDLRRPAGGPMLVAIYAGPRGCRLELRVQAGDLAAEAPGGSSRHRWKAGELSYELLAFGMPETRFAIIVGAAERQTRIDMDPDAIERQLREARVAAPPCVG